MNKRAFGARLREARKTANLTSEKLSELCGCTPVSIRQIESGTRLPSITKLVHLCNILKVTPDYFLASSISFNINEAQQSESDIKLEATITEIRNLPPHDIELVCSTIDAMIDHLSKTR